MNETQKNIAAKQMDRLVGERQAFIDAHLQRLSALQNERVTLIGSLTVASIRADGAPADVEAFVAKIEKLVDCLTGSSRRRQFEELKALLKDVNVHQLAPDIVWAAKQAGVVLFDEPAKVVADAPKLVSEG